jgi:type I restriction enzyme, S subunit
MSKSIFLSIAKVYDFEKGLLQSSKNTFGDYTFITASDTFKTHNSFDYDKEALCFAFAASGSLGRTHYINGKFTASDLVYVLTLKAEYATQVDLKFHSYFLNFNKEEIVRMTKSGSSKVSINRTAFATINIPLPPLPIQKEIVAKIEAIQNKLKQIQTLKAEQEKEINNLLYSKYIELIKDAKWMLMQKVAPIVRRQVDLDLEKIYNQIGVRSFGRGLFEKEKFKGADLTWQKPFWMKEGDLLFSNIKAWEGAVALIPKQYDNWVGSHRYLTCSPNNELINSYFLLYYILTQEGVEKLSSASPGTADRNRTLNTKMLMNIQVPIPTLKLQNEFVSMLHKFNQIKSNPNTQLTQLLPSLLHKAFNGELV